MSTPPPPDPGAEGLAFIIDTIDVDGSGSGSGSGSGKVEIDTFSSDKDLSNEALIADNTVSPITEIEVLKLGGAEKDVVRFDLSTFDDSYTIIKDESPNDILMLDGVHTISDNGDGTQTVSYYGSDYNLHFILIDADTAIVEPNCAPDGVFDGAPGAEVVGPGIADFQDDEIDRIDGGADDDILIGGVDQDTIHGATLPGLIEIKPDKFDDRNEADILHFDLTTFDNDFAITLKSKGDANDEIYLKGVHSSEELPSGDYIVNYYGTDGGLHTVTAEPGDANVQTFFRPAPDSAFADDHDLLYGDAGDDEIDDGHSDDTLDGSADNDTLDGGDGTDTYDANTSPDLAAEAINVTASQTSNGSVTRINEGTTDTFSSVETFITGGAPGETDVITLTGDVTPGQISGLNNRSIGTFTPYGGGGSIAFGGGGEPTINDILSGTLDPGTGSVNPRATYQITSGEEDGAQVGNVSFSNFEQAVSTSSVLHAARGSKPRQASTQGAFRLAPRPEPPHSGRAFGRGRCLRWCCQSRLRQVWFSES